MLPCARWDLLRQARNVISCVSIHSARAVKLFQAFVSPTVIPTNRSQMAASFIGQQDNRDTDVHYRGFAGS